MLVFCKLDLINFYNVSNIVIFKVVNLIRLTFHHKVRLINKRGFILSSNMHKHEASFCSTMYCSVVTLFSTHFYSL